MNCLYASSTYFGHNISYRKNELQYCINIMRRFDLQVPREQNPGNLENLGNPGNQVNPGNPRNPVNPINPRNPDILQIEREYADDTNDPSGIPPIIHEYDPINLDGFKDDISALKEHKNTGIKYEMNGICGVYSVPIGHENLIDEECLNIKKTDRFLSYEDNIRSMVIHTECVNKIKESQLFIRLFWNIVGDTAQKIDAKTLYKNIDTFYEKIDVPCKYRMLYFMYTYKYLIDKLITLVTTGGHYQHANKTNLRRLVRFFILMYGEKKYNSINCPKDFRKFATMKMINYTYTVKNKWSFVSIDAIEDMNPLNCF